EDVLPSGFLRGGNARRVVARDRGDEAVLRALPEGRAIGAVVGAKRRPDLGEGAPALHLAGGQEGGLRAGLRPDALARALGALDALEPEPSGEMHDVDGAVGEPADEDGAVDRLLLGPVGAGRREVGGRRAALGDRLVLEIAEDVAVFAVEL